MSRKRPIAIVLVICAVFSALVLLFSMQGSKQVKVSGYWRHDDPHQIERAVVHYCRTTVRESIVHHDFRLMFSGAFRDLAIGRVLEIGSLPDAPIIGYGQAITNATSHAYAIVGRRSFSKSLYFTLALETNCWNVVPPVRYQ